MTEYSLDAAKQKQTEEELRKTKDFLDNIIENSLDCIVATDDSGYVNRVNKSYLEVLGYVAEEVIGKHIAELSVTKEGTYESKSGETVIINNEFIKNTEKMVADLFENGKVSNRQSYLLRKDQRLVPVEENIVQLHNNKGDFIGSVGIIRDITARQKGEKALLEANDYLENIFNTTADGIIVTDEKGAIVKINRTAENMLGYCEAELIGKYTVELAPQDKMSRAKNAAMVEQLFEKGSVQNCEIEWGKKDGSLCPTEINISLMYDQEGNQYGTVATIRDISGRKREKEELRKHHDELEAANKKLTKESKERKQAVENLIKTKEQLENLIETSIDPINVSDSTGNITKANKAFLDMLGYSKEEVIGKPVYMFSITEKGTYESTTGETINIDEDFFKNNSEKIAQLFEEGNISNWVSYYINKDNKIIPVTQNIVLMPDDQGEITGSFGIIRDITEQQNTESDLTKAKEAAEEADRAKSNFLANMSHEIRTPMNGVTGFTDMLLDTALDAEQADYARTIKRSAESLLSLINDILDFSKIEAGKIEIEELDFDLEVLACDVCELIRPRLAEKDVEILFRIGDNLPAWVKGDPHRFKQILINLMGNAAKFTEKGEIELSLDVDAEEDERVMLHAKVRDTGIGVPADKLDTIFELFQQADDSTTRKYGGTGLGLSICKKIAAIMGGNVWVESEIGKGSTFHFTARLKQSDRKQAKRFTPVALAGKKVLITDDNKANLDILTHLLESAGMRVVGCLNGEETLTALQASASDDLFDIGILDIMMPGMSGYELAQKIRSSAGDGMPLLAFSSSTERGAQKCRGAGFNGFLPKPINRIRLFKMIERLLAEVKDGDSQGMRKAKIITQYAVREDAKHSISILVAEDNPVNQKLAEKLLTKAGYGIDIACNGRKAVDAFEASPEKYDLILMDVQMPELNGLDATKMLRDKGFKQIPIVAMTANAMKGDREKCLAAGMNDYIAKPIKREVVFEMIRKWVIEKV